MQKNARQVIALLIAAALCLSLFTPAAASAKAKKSASASSQKELKKQLSSKDNTAVAFSNKTLGKLKVAKGKYAKTVSFAAPKAAVTNSGQFSGITISDCKKFIEKASNNTLTIKDKKLSLTIDKASKGDTIKLGGKKGKIDIVINGSVKSIAVSKPTTLTLKGKPTGKVNITVAGKKSKVTADFTGETAITVKAKSTVTIGEKVKIATVTIAKAVDVTIANKSGRNITVVDNKKNRVTVPAGGSLKVSKGKAPETTTEATISMSKKEAQKIEIADPDDRKDTDKDGLTDYEEKQLGTDIGKADTDGDGLTDYHEVKELFLSPLVKDTDNNGILDFDEDYDGDGLGNGEEYKKGTDPIYPDTDDDGIDDFQELTVYYTDPLKADTDGDKADDGWEIEHGFDPKVANRSFVISENTGEASAADPVTASVELEVSNVDVSTLEITPVDVVDNIFISPSVAGYMGEAYNFSIDGNFGSATINMDYDKSFGEESDTFKPRIYYFNEESNTFEELPGQTVENGKISAKVNHFSTYILLNKVEVDKAWSRNIRYDAPKKDKDKNTVKSLDVVFVIDYSQSMDNNDPKGIRKEVAKAFVAKLDPERDKGSVVKFAAYATTLVPLTNNIEMLTNSIDQIVNNGGSSCDSEAGTNGSDGLNSALVELENSKADLRYIIFMTDGEDTTRSYEYSDIIDRAQKSGVTIFSIGMGESDETLLRNIAESTGGTYFFATSADRVENSDEDSLYDIMGDIENETVDFELDSNNDGISDYYTKLIKEGKLLLSNGSKELSGIDLNYDANGEPSADYDGDGLLNGEEITVVKDPVAERIYISMKSNPFLVHSDMDEFDDYTEVMQGSDPLKYSVSKYYTDILMNNKYYYYEASADNFYDRVVYGLSVKVNSIVFGVWDKDAIYENIMIDFFSDYNSPEILEYYELMEAKKQNYLMLSGITSSTRNVVDKFETAKDYTDLLKNIYTLVDVVNGAKTLDKINDDYYKMLSTAVVKLHNVSEEATKIRFESNGMDYVADIIKDTSSKKGVFKKLDDVSEKAGYVFAAIDCAIDVAETIGQTIKLNANLDCFKANIETLENIRKYSKDSHARDAALYIERVMSDSVLTTIEGSLNNILEAEGKLAVDLIAGAFLPSAVVKACIDVLGLVTGIDDEVTQQYEILCYHEISNAYVDLFKNKYFLGQKNNKSKYYEVGTSDATTIIRYLAFLTQSRLLGELKYIELAEYESLLGVFLNDTASMKQLKVDVDANMKNIKNVAGCIKTPVSKLVPTIVVSN